MYSQVEDEDLVLIRTDEAEILVDMNNRGVEVLVGGDV